MYSMMEWFDYHIRVTMIGFHNAGDNEKHSFFHLKPLDICLKFFYPTIQQYIEAGDIVYSSKLEFSLQLRTVFFRININVKLS